MDIIDVFDYMTPVPNIFVEEEEFYDLSHKELLELNKIVDQGTYFDDNGTTFSVNINDRYVVVHAPNDLPSKFSLVLFYHGLGDYAWDMAINKTNWRQLANQNKFIIVFVSGTNCGATHDRRCGFNIKNPDNELIHMEKVLEEMHKLYNINKTYYIGFSNGAIFSSIVAQKYGNKLFTAMVNIMGGFGHNCLEVSDMNISNPLPILFITGTLDEYKDSCIYAHNFFESKKYNSMLKILPNHDHTYPVGEEGNIWLFLNNML